MRGSLLVVGAKQVCHAQGAVHPDPGALRLLLWRHHCGQRGRGAWSQCATRSGPLEPLNGLLESIRRSTCCPPVVQHSSKLLAAVPRPCCGLVYL